jgi:hypothetical protein
MQKYLSHCVPMRIEFPLERNLVTLRVFNCQWCKRNLQRNFMCCGFWACPENESRVILYQKILFAKNLIVEKRGESLHISKCRGRGNQWFSGSGWGLIFKPLLHCLRTQTLYDANGCFPERLSVYFTTPYKSYWGRSAFRLTNSFMWMEEALCHLKENYQC